MMLKTIHIYGTVTTFIFSECNLEIRGQAVFSTAMLQYIAMDFKNRRGIQQIRSGVIREQYKHTAEMILQE